MDELLRTFFGTETLSKKCGYEVVEDNHAKLCRHRLTISIWPNAIHSTIPTPYEHHFSSPIRESTQTPSCDYPI